MVQMEISDWMKTMGNLYAQFNSEVDLPVRKMFLYIYASFPDMQWHFGMLEDDWQMTNWRRDRNGYR